MWSGYKIVIMAGANYLNYKKWKFITIKMVKALEQNSLNYNI